MGCPAPSARPRPWIRPAYLVDHVLSIEISDAEIEERMEDAESAHLRRILPHSRHAPNRRGYATAAAATDAADDDDRPETVRHRLEVYHQQTEPLKGTMSPKIAEPHRESGPL